MDELTQEEFEAQKVAAMEANMTADGVSTTEKVQADYFGFDEELTVSLPDGVSYVVHKVLTEGQRRKYLNQINRDVTIQKATGDAKMRMAPGDERFALLQTAIVGWNLKRNGMLYPFTPKALNDFLDKTNPKVVDLIEKAIRKANPWLLAEMEIEDIQREIDALEEMKAAKVEEEQGKALSSAR